jgi:MoxR-like ATPase
VVNIEGSTVILAEPDDVPQRTFVGREDELRMCRVAWGVSQDGTEFLPSEVPPLPFRLEGAPGLGKNEIVYEIARALGKPLYILQGHEEFTPEDLALLLAPAPEEAVYEGGMPMTLRASKLATAIHVGGLFFFDEINRVPERALSPLASVLDGRQSISSAMTGHTIKPPDEEARQGFRFCCALNPGLSSAGYVLPDYIEQRTLPVITISHPPLKDLQQIIKSNLNPSPDFLDAFTEWYHTEERAEVSVRQALALVTYAMSYAKQVGGHKVGLLDKVASYVIPRKS